MSAPPDVRLARRKDLNQASETLTDAFVDEDGLNWWLKQGDEKERARRRFFDVAVRDAVHPKRVVWVTNDFTGAAIWCMPGVTAFDLTPLRQLLLTPLLLQVAGVDGMKRAFETGETLAAHHPHVPHAHLVFLGVASRAQGQGVGSAILKRTLRDVDALKVPAYLEATKERNVALYLRHGFEVTAEFDVPKGGPHVWTMTRPAAG
ncbi:MAG: GNAT family N-acetyltransferase [Hyphomonadaceae bacterium]